MHGQTGAQLTYGNPHYGFSAFSNRGEFVTIVNASRADGPSGTMIVSILIEPNGEPPAACRADFNRDGIASNSDLFDFLDAWFAHTTDADFNQSGTITIQDLFDFIQAWFAGCG